MEQEQPQKKLGRPLGAKNKLSNSPFAEELSYPFVLLNLVHNQSVETIAKALDVSPIVIRAIMDRLHSEYALGHYDFLNQVMSRFPTDDRNVGYHLLKYNFQPDEE